MVTWENVYFMIFQLFVQHYILHTKTTAAQNEVALSYHKLRGLYFLAVVFVRSIVSMPQRHVTNYYNIMKYMLLITIIS